MRLFVGYCLLILSLSTCSSPAPKTSTLWDAYEQAMKEAKYVDLTHTITPHTPVAAAFKSSSFARATNPQTGKPYDYSTDGFAATAYQLGTDQLGTQLDPPAHWSADYPGIDELPPTFAVRPLVVISISDQVRRQPGYQLQIADIANWEKQHGQIPAGSVVFVRSDWSKHWNEPGITKSRIFPGIQLAAIQFLHLQRHILFHGHEPLDTDTTATYQSEGWLLRHGYAQAEGVCCLDKVPETGALVIIGYPKFGGGVGGYARYIAVCPADWPYGTTINPASESPLPRQAAPLQWDDRAGMRIRSPRQMTP